MNTLDEINDILEQWASQVVVEIQENLDRTGTNASGRTRESLEYELTESGVRILGRQYFQGVEQGRPGGKVPYRFQDIIRKWMDEKGIANQFGSTEREKRSAAYFISRFIKENGTKLYREGGRTDIFSNVIDEEVDNLADQILFTIEESIVEGLGK